MAKDQALKELKTASDIIYKIARGEMAVGKIMAAAMVAADSIEDAITEVEDIKEVKKGE